MARTTTIAVHGALTYIRKGRTGFIVGKQVHVLRFTHTMNIKKNDWIGIGASVVLHILLLVLFGAWSLRTPEPEALGYIEVEFGPFSEGRPVQRAAVDEPQAPEQPEVEPQPEQPEPEASPPEVARPVDAPDVAEEISDPERIQQPEAETIAPTQQDNPAE